MKKLIAFLLAAMMVLSLSAAAFADAGDHPGPITITGTNTNHTYIAYEVLAGDVEQDPVTGMDYLANIRWGCNVNAAGMEALVNNYSITIPAGSTAADMAATVANAIKGTGANGAKALANLLLTTDGSGNYLYIDSSTVTPAQATASGNNATLNVHHQGYYVVIDVPGSLDGKVSESYTDAMVVVVGEAGATAAHKNSVPTFVKKVQENGNLDDGTGTTDSKLPGVTIGNNYNDVADYQIGDAIPYVLIATVNSDIDRYNTYSMRFSDTMNGTKYIDGSLRVVLRHTSGEYELPLTVAALDRVFAPDRQSFTLTLKAEKDPAGKFIVDPSNPAEGFIDAGTRVYVYYSAELTADALVGSAGNTNTAKLEFSNNPNNSESMGSTPDDTNIVYTYALEIVKTNAETKEKLAGAGFKLQNKTTGQWAVMTPAATIDVDGTATPVSYKLSGWAAAEADGTEFFTVAQQQITLIGLDEQHYYLKETTAPNGYSALESMIELAIVADTHTTQGYDGTKKLDKLTLDLSDPNNMSAAINGGSGNVSAGTVGLNIANNATAQLPTTGGVGTTLFYVFGAVMALGAAILLIVKRRMSVVEM